MSLYGKGRFNSYQLYEYALVWFMVLSTTFNDISVILVEETGESGENHRPAVISSVNDLHFDV
jgi:hypothetical protein